MSDVDRIIRDLVRGDSRLTKHAKERMEERGVQFDDIRCCGETVRKTREQDGGKFLIVGEDRGGDELKVVAAWDGETLIVTLIGD
jgi:hypothetical protein